MEIKFKLNLKFYSKEAIQKAIKDFNHICKGKIINNQIQLSSEKEIKNLKEEFCNYVFGIMYK